MFNEAPISERVVDENDKARPAWVEFFSLLTRGDIGTTWNPNIVNLGSVGAPTITGVYYQNNGFTDFAIKIVPTTNTSSVLGSTSVLLPFNATVDTGAFVIAGNTSSTAIVNSSSDTLFFPTWTNITSTISITGRVKN